MHDTDIDPALIEQAREPLRQRALRAGAEYAGLIPPDGTYCHYGKGKVVYRVTGARPHGHDDGWAVEITPEPGQHPKSPFWTEAQYLTVINPPTTKKKGKK